MSDAPRDRCRERLPNRRLANAEIISWEGKDWLLTVGWYHSGRVGEIFLDGPKIGSDAEGALDAAAMLISRDLQEGRRLADIARWLGGEANIVGYLAGKALEIEIGHGEKIAAAYRALDAARAPRT
jgi:hypothetical protein